MDTAFLDKMQGELHKLKKELIDKLVVDSAEFKQLVEDMDPKDLADIASEDIDRKMIETVSTQDLKRLRSIENALSRIRNNHYGLCIKCNKKIPSARLEAIPYALMCIECKTSDERRNR